MATSDDLRSIFAAGRPLVEQALDAAEQIAALREVATAKGLDWSQVKALLKAQIQDERDESGEGKRVKRIVEKAEFASAYADMLGLANMNENNFSPEQFDAETGEVINQYAAAQAGEKIWPETADVVAPKTGAAVAGVSGQPEMIPANADGRNAEATVEQRPSATPFPLPTSSETRSAGAPSPTSGETDLVEAGTGQNSAVLPQEPCTADFQPPAFLAREDKPFRPNCLNPGDNCGGQGNQHCYSCRKAMAESEAVPA